MREPKHNINNARFWQFLFIFLASLYLPFVFASKDIHAQVMWPHIAAEIDYSYSAPQNSKPLGLAWDGEDFWLSDDLNDTIYKINPNDGSVILSFPSPGPKPFGLAWDGQYLWHADCELDTVYKLNPSDGSVISSIPIPGQRDEVSHPIASLAWDGQNLWTPFYSRNGSFLYKIDPTDGSILDSFSLSETPLGLSGTFFCMPGDLAWDEGYLYMSASADCRIEGQDPPLPWDNYILRYDPVSRTFQVYVRVPPVLSGLTLDADGRIWFTVKEVSHVCRIITFEITQDQLTTDDHEFGGGPLNYYPTVTLSALNDQVALIYYRINDGDTIEGTIIYLDTDGKFSVRYWGVDTEGRVEYPYNFFSITIYVPPVDTTPPQVSYPETINLQADDYAELDSEGEPEQVAYVIFTNYISVSDDMDDHVTLTYDPPNPYPVGTTIVSFTATDDAGNTTSGSFSIIVEENPDMQYLPSSYGNYFGSGTFTVFYGPWNPGILSYSGYIRTQDYGSYSGYTYGLPSPSVLSFSEYQSTPNFSSYGGYYSGGNGKTFGPLFSYMAPWRYLNPSFLDYFPYTMNTGNFSYMNRLRTHSLSPFYDIPSYEYLMQPFSLDGILENIPATFLFSR